MQHRSLQYTAYLIRLWEEGQPGEWRASAQHVQSGETVRFADITQLFDFLQAKVRTNANAEGAAHGNPDNSFES